MDNIQCSYFPYGDQETDYLKKKDKKLGAWIDRIGHINLEVDTDLFSSVVHQIIGQQIAISTLDKIWGRLLADLGPLDAGTILAAGEEKLRAYGIPRQRVDWILGFARDVQTGDISLSEIAGLSDEEAIRTLTRVRGIGTWTAEMILLFGFKRPDIFSYQDLLIQKGLCMIYHHKKIDRARFERYRKRYSPYGTVASLYLWEVAGGR